MNARSFAAGTSVSAEKSRMEIEQLLSRSGASRFGSITDIERRKAMIGFTFKGLSIQMEVPLPDPQDKAFTRDRRQTWRAVTAEAAAERYDAEVRRRWRCLALALKAKMVSVADGVTTFEKEFLPYVVTASGVTIGDRLMPLLEAAKAGATIPANLALPEGRGES